MNIDRYCCKTTMSESCMSHAVSLPGVTSPFHKCLARMLVWPTTTHIPKEASRLLVGSHVIL
jgi:hypothetical protein